MEKCEIVYKNAAVKMTVIVNGKEEVHYFAVEKLEIILETLALNEGGVRYMKVVC